MPDRFPPPYIVKDTGNAWAVSDANGFTITWFHYQDDKRFIGTSPDRMTRKQAYAFAANFAKLPALILTQQKVP